MGRSRIAFLICVFNEYNTIFKIIQQCQKFGDVIIIDDCSTDRSGPIIKQKRNIFYYKNKKNLGYDKSINRGFGIVLKKKYDYVITVDGDGQHGINQIKKIIYLTKFNYDCICSIRNKFSNFYEIILSYITYKKFKLNDILCGLKAYKISSCRKVKNSNIFINNNIGLFYFMNLLIRKNFKIKKVKIKIQSRKYFTSRFYKNFLSKIIILSLISKVIFLQTR